MYPAIARHAKRTKAEISFWDESGVRADAVHGKTWGARAHTPVGQIPGQRQRISAASAICAKGAFWFATYTGAVTGPLFVDLLRRMMRGRRKPLHLILDGLPAHKALTVKEYVAELAGKLTLPYLPGYAPDLNPDEWVWSHAKRTGNARRPLQKGERLADRIAPLARRPALVRSFFRHPGVASIAACAFVGVAPRIYGNLFHMTERKDRNG
jgi:transposase